MLPKSAGCTRLLSAVDSIVQALATTTTLDETLRTVLQTCVALLDAEGGTIYIHDRKAHSLQFRHVVPQRVRDALPFESMSDTTGVAGDVLHSGKTRIDVAVDDVQEHDRRVDEATGVQTRSLITTPLPVNDGKPVGVLQLVNKSPGAFSEEDREVLEIVASVAALSIRNTELAEKAQRAARLEAMGDIAHDIKNKVGPLTMAVELLNYSVPRLRDQAARNEPVDDVINEIDRVAGSLMESTKEAYRYTMLLADVAKGRTLEPSLDMYDLGDVVRKQTLRHHNEAEQAEVQLNVECPALEWRVDRIMIERLISNLVQNAIEATPPGGTVTVTVQAQVQGAVIAVSDTGRGMNENQLLRLLEGQADSTHEGGTGLGHRICKQIAEAHGGRLEGSSAIEGGTRLTVVLPPL